MKKIDKCPNCGVDSPVLTLRLQNPELYETRSKVPDNRTYEEFYGSKVPAIRTYDIVCINCDEGVESSTVDNSLWGIKKLRDEMDILYGESRITWSSVGGT